MTDDLCLYGYSFSVYTRVARLALEAKSATYDFEEVNPFLDTQVERATALHPFRRVPILTHGDFRLYETSAITRYVDAVLDGPRLMPNDPRTAARAEQVIAMVDAYAYWPMVRQVFVQRVMRPHLGERPDEADFQAGLAASKPVLSALNDLAKTGDILQPRTFTLADCHLVPMVDYFQRCTEGAALLAEFSALSLWWGAVSQHPAVAATRVEF